MEILKTLVEILKCTLTKLTEYGFLRSQGAFRKGGGSSLRKQILETVKEMGYEINYAASSIKQAPRHIAAVLPEDDGLYFDFIWRGFRAMAKEARGLNIEIEEFACRDEQHQYELFKQIADAGGEEYAGVVTFSYMRTRLPTGRNFWMRARN